jgi:predicted double-glycine peptidase
VAVLAVRSAAQEPRRTLLDVPFVAQSEALCGGAAAAMVLRYWGAGPVYAEDFAPLVDESAEGITLSELSRAITERGWRAQPFSATATDVQSHLAHGRPVITLIEDRPGTLHYVVIVAWSNDRVVLHDPAHGPFRVVDVAKFERAWAVTQHTSLLVLPLVEKIGGAAAMVTTLQGSTDSCSEPLEEAVRLARDGDLVSAEALLLLVEEVCPRSGARRELAGIRFLQQRWAEAVDLAAEALARNPSDMHAWQLLASSRFLQGDQAGALHAWNHRAEPRIDLARIDGLDRTPHDVVANLLDLAPDDVLTDAKLARAKRRVAALPALQSSRVSYTPRADGRATVDVDVLERPLVPRRWPSLAAMGLHAAIAREARLETANSTGNGELLTASWRWWANRPRVAVALATPQLWRATGLWRIHGSWERQLYLAAREPSQGSSTDALFTSERRRAGLSFGDWASGDLRWEMNGGFDRWVDGGNHASLGGAVERRVLDDQVALRADGTMWREVGGAARGFGSSAVAMAWRSAPDPWPTWTMKAGLYGVSASAPIDLWPAPGTGHVGPLLLRAHPLLHDGTIRSSDVSRVLAHGTLERQQLLSMRPPAPLLWAVFVDVVKRAAAEGAGKTHVDVGTGLRIDLPGTASMLRLDIARGLRDGRMALSMGWQTTWPGW